MHKQKELTRDNVRHTKLIRFWSEGKMSQTAHQQIVLLASKKRRAELQAMLSELIIE